MSTMPLANTIVTWYRATAVLLDAVAVAASHVMTRQPTSKCCVRVTLTGTATGTVTVSGTVDGVGDSEVLTWSATSGGYSTVKEFTAISGVATSLTGASTIKVETADVEGQPVPQLVTLHTGYPVQIQEVTFPYGTGSKPGINAAAAVRINVDWTDTWTPRIDDIVKDESSYTADAIYKVTGVPAPKRGSLGPSHWQVEAQLDRSSLDL